MSTTAHAILNSELFAGLSSEQARRLDRLAEPVRLKEGAVLFSAGQTADNLYVVLDGAVELRMPVPRWWGIDTPHQKMTTAQPGQIVGWSALVEPYVYSLTAVASGRASAARFDGGALLCVVCRQSAAGHDGGSGAGTARRDGVAGREQGRWRASVRVGPPLRSVGLTRLRTTRS